MEATSIVQTIELQRDFFKSGATKSIAFRKAGLKRFRESIAQNESLILDALYEDFKKPRLEGVLSETGASLSAIDQILSKLDQWAKPKRVSSTLVNFPSRATIFQEPYGQVLVIAPWNYPFLLAVEPLVGAIAAGNTVVLKPSELTPHTSKILEKIVSESFEKSQVSVIQGDKEVAQELLSKRWDYIFFTGSVAVGKIVAKAAATHLTPVTLELGGKSPCIVDGTTPMAQTAKRIVWGKFFNAGQTCIAPDYILVSHEKKEALLNALAAEISHAYGVDPKLSPDFARIINTKNFDRLAGLLEEQHLFYGGTLDASSRYIAPTILDNPKLDSPVMKEEIFGPILPILSYSSEEDIVTVISQFEKPLSAYIFTKRNAFREWFINTFSFGGGAVNDCIVHFVNDNLPFGGVGHSGMGSYHGKKTFETFSHSKSIVKKGTWLDLPMRYAPYAGKLKGLKKALKWL